MSRIARTLFGAAPAVLLAVALLTACTSAAPEATVSASSLPSKTATPGAVEPSAPPTIEAVLVVASVDVDGKNVSASGYIQGVVEDGAPCVFTYERDGATVTADGTGAADRMTTSCGLVQSPIEDFTRGSWTLTLSYEHDGTTYTSIPTTVEVP
ncbi:hypothetical protein [Leifsonia naganoensis]|uniref:Uncharacterized protein n=1 Tax=Leifsonia naganoensis TaxID=150025 RepID=A0A853DQA5_9MICO|nr:hypothetical protein [Leifsonia naganoensis]NYK08734.1 hypothetical protein [Leifsonia naganoensis]